MKENSINMLVESAQRQISSQGQKKENIFLEINGDG